mmetsp:Transcript_3660/g.8013  ORF Transcript_3660/g.8013 Transcript_3660/m.8013 type:complete len:599 (+) Transcript_3660:117-1913(+)
MQWALSAAAFKLQARAPSPPSALAHDPHPAQLLQARSASSAGSSVGAPSGGHPISADTSCGQQALAAALAAGTALLWQQRRRRRSQRQHLRVSSVVRHAASDPSSSALGSLLDLPKSKALGIEVRASSALGAPISAQDGSVLQEPYRVKYALDGDHRKNASTLQSALQEIVKHFDWKGVVGCSITREVGKRVGVHDLEFSSMEQITGLSLSKGLRSVPFFHTMVHTTPAAYYELVWGNIAEESWRGKVMLVITLGKHLGAVLFSDGRRVKYKSWCTLTVSAISDAEFLQGGDISGAFTPPEVGTEAWGQWTSLIDTEILSIIQAVPDLNSVVVIPTGSSKYVSNQALQQALTKSAAVASSLSLEFQVISSQEDGVLRGAALGALAELQTEQMLTAFEPVLNGTTSLQALSEAQLRAVYSRLDPDANGISRQEMRDGLQLLGIQCDADSLYEELQDGQDGNIMEEPFVRWWWNNVHGARTVTMTSAEAWKKVLASSPPPGFGTLVLMMVTFTFCRTCKRFEPKFQRLAEAFPEVRFVKFVANGTVGAAELSNELGVTQAPHFFLYRRGGELLTSWQGINVEELQRNLQQAMQQPAQAAS